MHLSRPAKKPAKLPPLAPEQAEELRACDVVGVHAEVRFEAPAQIGTGPGPETIAASDQPAVTQGPPEVQELLLVGLQEPEQRSPTTVSLDALMRRRANLAPAADIILVEIAHFKFGTDLVVCLLFPAYLVYHAGEQEKPAVSREGAVNSQRT